MLYANSEMALWNIFLENLLPRSARYSPRVVQPVFIFRRIPVPHTRVPDTGFIRIYICLPDMASSVGDGALKPLQRAMKLANKAIQLDTGNRHRDAYVEYLKSVNFISQILAEEAEQKVNEGLSPDSQKMLKLAEQCLERARTTAGKLGKPNINLQSLENQISEVPDAPSTLKAARTTPISSFASLPMTSQVSVGHQYGHRRACSDEAQKLVSFPTPEVFQMLRAAEVQSSRKDLTPLEEASIQNQKLRAAYEVRLARLNPSQASQKTSLTLSLQRQMMENLVIAKAREETLQRKAEERRLRLQEESNRRFSKNKQMTPAEEEQKALYTAMLEYEQDYEWPKVYKEKIRSNPGDADLVSSYVCQILSTSDHPIAKLLIHLQCQIYNRIYSVISKDNTQETSISKPFRHSLPADPALLSAFNTSLKSSKSLHCLPGPPRPSIQHSHSIGEGLESWENSVSTQLDKALSKKDMENSFEDLESLLSPTLLAMPAALQRLTMAQHLNIVVKEIHNARDRLLSSTMFSLNLPTSPQVKEACLECLEESFFPPLWPALLALYRQVLFAREQSLLQVMDLYSTAMPSVVGVPVKLYPEDIKEPYKAAVEDLEHLPHQRTPQRKLECIVRTLRVICECTEEYCPTPGTAAIGADDLLPILAFVVLKSHMSHLLSECAALEEFIHEGYLIGEEGYCLTSLQSALAYLETLPVPPSPPPV
ncbi:VPS9 domain-containing protein 1 [Dendropsophus ebraccatus]|uniref:VPS9 domain-containing protein 1 n=1 Tax=Dendropsophus ebraccatus TaxID=150705 RepID=UPI0038318251